MYESVRTEQGQKIRLNSDWKYGLGQSIEIHNIFIFFIQILTYNLRLTHPLT